MKYDTQPLLSRYINSTELVTKSHSIYHENLETSSNGPYFTPLFPQILSSGFTAPAESKSNIGSMIYLYST